MKYVAVLPTIASAGDGYADVSDRSLCDLAAVEVASSGPQSHRQFAGRVSRAAVLRHPEMAALHLHLSRHHVSHLDLVLTSVRSNGLS